MASLVSWLTRPGVEAAMASLGFFVLTFLAIVLGWRLLEAVEARIAHRPAKPPHDLIPSGPFQFGKVAESPNRADRQVITAAAIWDAIAGSRQTEAKPSPTPYVSPSTGPYRPPIAADPAYVEQLEHVAELAGRLAAMVRQEAKAWDAQRHWLLVSQAGDVLTLMRGLPARLHPKVEEAKADE